MDVDIQLTPGACQMMLTTTEGDLSANAPRVQCISFKLLTMATDSAPDRYRVILSDGEFYIQTMLNTALNHLVEDGTIKKNVTFKVQLIANNMMPSRRLIILLKIDEDSVLMANDRIGEPKSLVPKNDANPTGASDSPGAGTTPPAPAPVPQPAQQPLRTPAPPAAARSTGGERPAAILPIEGLSPYQNKWTIRARVTQKSEMKHWSNARGEGKLFGCTFMDNSGEIRATAFNEAADRFYDTVQEGKVYFVSRARVSVAKKKFNATANEYEIQLERQSEIVECQDDADAPKVKYNFATIDQVATLQKDTACDVIAVVHELGHIGEIVSKANNKPVSKRDLTLVDRSGSSIRCTLWGRQAEGFTAENNPVVAFKGVRVGDFGGPTLSMISTSTMQTDPDIPEAHLLRGWYDTAGTSTSFRSTGTGGGGGGGAGGFRREEVKTLDVVQDTLLGLGDKPDYFSTRARVVHIKQENISYTACPGQGCQKKVIEQDDGTWRCEKCAKSYPDCEYRYLLSISVADHTGQIWLQGFNDVGETLLGITAKDLHELFERDRDLFIQQISKAIGKQWNLSCRVKQETYNEQTRARYGVNRVFDLNYAEESKNLLEQLKGYPPSVAV